MFSPLSIIFRVISISFIVYILKDIVQDEQKLEDIRDFTTKGVSDLFDYSKEWEFGKLKLNGKGE